METQNLSVPLLSNITISKETNVNYNEDDALGMEDIEYDGLENIARYISHKLKLRDTPSAANETYTWRDHLSEGGLTKPSRQSM